MLFGRFSDAFAFLHRLPKEEHCWCGNKDVMLPLLEPFYNLPEDLSPDSSLRKLWQRVALELGKCTRCVVQHHKGKEFYKAEYLEDVVGPLLVILQVMPDQPNKCLSETVDCCIWTIGASDYLSRLPSLFMSSLAIAAQTNSTLECCFVFVTILKPSKWAYKYISWACSSLHYPQHEIVLLFASCIVLLRNTPAFLWQVSPKS